MLPDYNIKADIEKAVATAWAHTTLDCFICTTARMEATKHKMAPMMQNANDHWRSPIWCSRPKMMMPISMNTTTNRQINNKLCVVATVNSHNARYKSHFKDCCYNTIIHYGRPMEQGRPLYFCPVISFFLSLSSPNLRGRRSDVYHTSTHGLALVRI